MPLFLYEPKTDIQYKYSIIYMVLQQQFHHEAQLLFRNIDGKNDADFFLI